MSDTKERAKAVLADECAGLVCIAPSGNAPRDESEQWITAACRQLSRTAASLRVEAQAKHDPRAGPCPTCGHQILRVERPPFTSEDDGDIPCTP